MKTNRKNGRKSLLVSAVSLLLTFLALFGLVGGLTAQRDGPPQPAAATVAPQLSLSKGVSAAQVAPGGTLTYTLVVSNAGDGIATAFLTDTLPLSLTLNSGSVTTLPVGAIELGWGVGNGVITWTGSIGAAGLVTIGYSGLVTDSTPLGTVLTNTATATGDGGPVTAVASSLVTQTQTVSLTNLLPMVARQLPAPTLSATDPDASYRWTLSWNSLGSQVTGYRLEEAQDPAFSTGITVYNMQGNETSRQVQHNPPASAAYYYRLRGEVNGNPGLWSATIMVVTLNDLTLQATAPTPDNTWTVSWNSAGAGVSVYQLQESQAPDFSSGVTQYDLNATSRAFARSISARNVYYYRVRAVIGATSGPWSPVLPVIGNYRDGFNSASTNWAMRRTNASSPSVTYRNNDQIQIQIPGTDKYVIASPLRPAPWLDYEIGFEARFQDQRDRHMYGLIFGADYDGTSPCPNAGYTSCFTQYYLLRIQYRSATTPYLEFKLKRVDGHDGNNQPFGPDLIDWTRVNLSDAAGWQTWQVEVEGDRDIKISRNGVRLASVRDDDMPNPLPSYFGVLGETKQNGGLTVRYDNLEVVRK